MGLTTLILFAAAVVGSRMAVRGWRGRAVDDHPVCARCKFDLTGLPAVQGECPECGASLADGHAVEVGNRQRRVGLMVGGLAVALLATLPLLTAALLATGKVDPIRVEPLWWLLRDATRDRYDHRPITAEILSRVQHGSLSAGDDRKVVAAALRLQADLSWPWDPTWGDIVEDLHAGGRLSAADWQAYLAHDEPATFEVRSRVARGDPIPFCLHGELRGATPCTTVGSWSPWAMMSVPGSVVENPNSNWGVSSGGTTFVANGYATLTAKSWDALRPGPQTLTVRFASLSAGTARTPSLFAPLVYQGTWTALPAGERSVDFYRDEALAARVQRTLSVRLGGNSRISVDVSADLPPADLGWAVFLRSGGRELASPGNWAVDERNGNGHGTAEFSGDLTGVGPWVDVVLKPSVAAAAHTVHMTRLLDHEFVFPHSLISYSR